MAETLAPSAGVGLGVPNPRTENGGSTPPDTSTPQDKLREIESRIQHLQAELAKENKELKWQQDDKKAVENLIAAFKKILEDYEKALLKLKEQTQDLRLYSQTKTPMIETAIGPGTKSALDGLVAAEDGEISKVENQVKQLQEAANSVKVDYDTRKAEYEVAVQEFETLKSRLKYLQDRLKALDDYRKKIEDEENKSKFGNMYFLMQQSNKVLAEVTVLLVEKGTLESDLMQSWRKMTKLQAEHRKLETRWQELQTTWSRKRDQVKSLKDNREENILKRIEELLRTGGN